jgi:hypothetical protein
VSAIDARDLAARIARVLKLCHSQYWEYDIERDDPDYPYCLNWRDLYNRGGRWSEGKLYADTETILAIMRDHGFAAVPA